MDPAIGPRFVREHRVGWWRRRFCAHPMRVGGASATTFHKDGSATRTTYSLCERCGARLETIETLSPVDLAAEERGRARIPP